MSAQLETTLRLRQSLREARHALDVLVMSTQSGNVVTVDKAAVRLWSLQRQIKASHIEKVKGQTTKAIGAYYLEDLDVFLLVYSHQIPPHEPGWDPEDEEEDTRPTIGGMIQVWSPALHLLQEVELQYKTLKKCILNPAKRQLILVDGSENMFVVEILHRYEKQPPLPPFMEAGPSHKTKVPDKLRLYFTQLQLIIQEDPELSIDALFVDDCTFAVLYATEIVCYSRKPDGDGDGDKADFSDLGTGNMNELDEEKEVYRVSHTFSISCPGDAFPVSMVWLEQFRYAVGFSCGAMRVVLCNPALEGEVDRSDSQIIAQRQAHEGAGAMVLLNVDWKMRAPGGHDVEFLTVGGGPAHVKVWGLRYAAAVRVDEAANAVAVYSLSGVESLADIPRAEASFVLDELGRYRIVPEPSSKVVSKKLQAIHVGRMQVVSYELKVPHASNPVRRELLCGLGGMLAFIEVHQPFARTAMYGLPMKIVDSCCGPALTFFSNAAAAAGSTSLILQQEHVDVIDSANGQLVQQYSTQYLFDRLKDPSIVTLGKNNEFYEATREREGRPTAVHWCHLHNLILVGYSTGGVGVLVPNSSKVYRINASQCHSTSIRSIYSFYQQLKRSYNSCLLIGDETGVLSLWRLEKQEYRLIKCTEPHSGAIIYAGSISGCNEHKHNSSGIDKILITACSKGIVKAWVQHHISGELLLTSFFKASAAMDSFLPMLLVNTASAASVEKKSVMHDKGDTGTLGTNASLDGSVTSFANATGLVVYVLCLCGLNNGVMEGWVLSSNTDVDSSKSYKPFPGVDVMVPLWSLPCHEAPISTITKMRNTQPDLLQESLYQTVCSSIFGSSVLLQIRSTGELVNQPFFFTLPFAANNVLPLAHYSEDGPASDEFLVVGDHQIVEICPATSADVTARWHAMRRDTGQTITNFATHTDGGEEDDVEDSAEQDDGLIPENSVDGSVSRQSQEAGDFEAAMEEKGDNKDGSITDEFYNGVSDVPGINFRYSASSEAAAWQRESMTSMERAATSDLFFAKKDQRLISLFTQAEKVHREQSLITYDTALDIINVWLEGAGAANVAVRDVLQLLGILPGEKLPFIKLAKVAALAAAFAKRQSKETLDKLGISDQSASSLLNSYYNLRTQRKVVSYNAMGEASVETIGMSKRVASGRVDGLLRRFHTATISKVGQPSKLLPTDLAPARYLDTYFHSVKSVAQATILQEIPSKFAKHFKSKWLVPVEMPSTWDSHNQHWFDLRRSVRVARTILDMRASKQHEHVLNPEDTPVGSLAKLVCLYFERSFGHGRLNVSNHKIVHFLEACLQYVHCPVMNFLQLFLCPAVPSDEPSELCLWVYCELRHFLYQKGVVEDGEVIPATDFGETSSNSAKIENALLRWQLISRNEAMIAVDEMFRIRGRFGVQALHRLFQALEGIPDAEHKDLHRSMVDLEVFLYIVTIEFHRIEHLMKDIEQTLFDPKNVPIYRVATARDIYTDIPEKIMVNFVARNINVTRSLERIRELTVQFVHHDQRRLGIVDQITFRSIIVVAGQAILNFEYGRDAHKLADACLSRFRDDSPESPVCYADLIATLIAFVVLDQGGTMGLDGASATHAVSNTNIGIGDKEATALMLLLGLMQCPAAEDCLWTATSKTPVHDKKGISKEGNWMSRPPISELDFNDLTGDNQEIGSVSVLGKSAVGGAAVPEQPGLEVRQSKTMMHQTGFAYVPKTERTMISSLSQEVLNLSSNKTLTGSQKPKAKLTVQDMSITHYEKEEEPVLKYVPEGSRLSNEGSYSRSLTKLVDARINVSPIPNPSQFGAMSPAGSEAELSGTLPYQLDPMSPTDQQNMFSQEKMQAQAGTFIREKLANDEVERRKATMTSDEQSLLLMMEIEAEKIAKTRALKQAKMLRQQAEAKAKEKISMRFKGKQDRARMKRAEEGRKLHEAAVLQMNLDVNAAFAEVKAKQDAERERVRMIKMEKENAEELLKEKERETNEGILMRAQEKASHAYEKAVKEKYEKETAEREAKEAKEAELAAKKREEERIAFEAAEAIRIKKEAEEAAELEETNRRRDYKGMKAEDINVLKIPTAEELEQQAAEEAAAAAEAIRLEEEKAALRPKTREKRSRPGTKGRSRPSTKGASRPTTVGGDDQSPDGSIGEWDDDDYEDDEDSTVVEYTPQERRFVEFLGKMKVADKRNADHPRRQVDKASYFMPMLFADDIKYSNFEGVVNDEAHRLGTWTLETMGKSKQRSPQKVDESFVEKKSGFEDIAQKVKEHKLKLIRDRLANLYRTSSEEDSSAEWTEVMKRDFVDWISFFDEQEGILMNRPATPPPPVDEEAEFLKKIAGMAQALKEQPEFDDYEMPQSLPIPVDEANASVQPLPLGKVARDIVLNDSFKYYQVEVVDANAVHTFEVKSIRGYADIYISNDSLPTKVNYERNGMSGDDNNRIVRVFFEPGKIGTMFIGIHSELGASYELWGFASGHVSTIQEPIENVSSALRRWEIIQNHTVEEMETMLPELMVQAADIVKFENTMAKPSILVDLQESGYDPQKQESGDADSDDEIAVMDSFISKAGRRLIRKDILAGKGLITDRNRDGKEDLDEDGDEIDYIDPNSHVELFKQPALLPRKSYLNIVKKSDRLDHDENYNFTMLSLQKRKNHPYPANPMSLSLPNLNVSSSIRESVASSRWGHQPSSVQKPFKLPKNIVTPLQKISYTLHRTAGGGKRLMK